MKGRKYRALQWEALDINEYIVCGPNQRSRVGDARERCLRLGLTGRDFVSRKLTLEECKQHQVEIGAIKIIRHQ
jgi:hypothetical protein